MKFTKQHLNGFNVQGYGQDRTWKMQCERLDASFWSCLRTARRLAAQTVRGSQWREVPPIAGGARRGAPRHDLVLDPTLQRGQRLRRGRALRHCRRDPPF
jgi:hypothetical protein